MWVHSQKYLRPPVPVEAIEVTIPGFEFMQGLVATPYMDDDFRVTDGWTITVAAYGCMASTSRTPINARSPEEAVERLRQYCLASRMTKHKWRWRLWWMKKEALSQEQPLGWVK